LGQCRKAKVLVQAPDVEKCPVNEIVLALLFWLAAAYGAPKLEQIQFLLGHVSVETTERYLGCNLPRLRQLPDIRFRGNHSREVPVQKYRYQ
jgi:hypothetical protein